MNNKMTVPLIPKMSFGQSDSKCSTYSYLSVVKVHIQNTWICLATTMQSSGALNYISPATESNSDSIHKFAPSIQT